MKEEPVETADADMEGAPEAPEIAVPSKKEGDVEREKMAARAGIVGLGTLASRILGFGRDVVIAALFPRHATDAFAVALTIPNALRQLLAEGAVSSAVVPVLTDRLAKGGDDAGRAFFARARGVSLVALFFVSIAGVLLAGPLAELFAPGSHAIPEQFERTTMLTRVMFPYIFFMGTAALGMAALNSKKKFAVAAFTPTLFNVCIIAGALLLRGPLEARGADPTLALGIGVVAGGLFQVLAQWPALRAIGYASRPIFDFSDPHVRAMLKRILPMTFGLGIYYVDLTLSRRYLSELGLGAQSWFFWASRLCDFPQGVFVMALSTAALPSLATFAAKNDTEELVKTWAHGMRLAMFVAIPCSIALVAIAEPLVVLLFQRGAFDALSARETAAALVWQGGAIFTVAAVRQLVGAFYAVGDTKTPVIVSGVDLLVFIVLAEVCKKPFGHVGISIAVAGSSAAQMVLLFVFLRRRLGGLRGGELGASAARVLTASVIAGGAAWGAARLLLPTEDGVFARALPGLGGAFVFSAVFLVAAWGLGARELSEVLGPIGRRLRRLAGSR